MIFTDASALIALIVGESDADDLANRLEADTERICSALSVWETVAGLCHSHGFTASGASMHVQRFQEAMTLRLVPIARRELEYAVHAYATYGKGRHPAALNMGDCYAYACAMANNAKLLFKGNDFGKTDIVAA